KKRRRKLRPGDGKIPEQKPCDVGVYCRRLCRAYLRRSPLPDASQNLQAACQFREEMVTA
ncbi:hypothetical protein ACC761_40655, partial [Rhizobium ruizarguesonis]